MSKKNGNIHPTRIFKTPEDLKKVWNEYKSSLIEQALKWGKVQYVGRDGEQKIDFPKIPLTKDGFEVYCYEKYGCIGQYFDNQKQLYDDFVAICSHITKECRSDQIIGGLLGFYNPSITQRLNNLKETVDNNLNASVNILSIDPLADD